EERGCDRHQRHGGEEERRLASRETVEQAPRGPEGPVLVRHHADRQKTGHENKGRPGTAGRLGGRPGLHEESHDGTDRAGTEKDRAEPHRPRWALVATVSQSR